MYVVTSNILISLAQEYRRYVVQTPWFLRGCGIGRGWGVGLGFRAWVIIVIVVELGWSDGMHMDL